MKQTEYNQYLIHCIVCGATDKLMLLPNRNGIGQMVGWHFVCPECIDNIAGKETQTAFGMSDVDDIMIN